MSATIRRMDAEAEAEYESLLAGVPTGLLYHSLNYRNFLRDILDDSKDRYLLAYEGSDLVAALPAFVKQGPYGAVVNSLPFYGSHGSIIASEKASRESKHALLNAFDGLCQEEGAVTSTIVSCPLEVDAGLLEGYRADLFDERIGQFTRLPAVADPETVGAMLMDSFHQKTRNTVKKGEKSGFAFGHDGSEETFSRLHAIHDANMKTVGGLAKPWRIFQAIRRNFAYDRDYRIYTARKDGTIVSALLVFFFNRTAEYFTPATLQEHRSEQPLSYMIFQAMRDAAVSKGCHWWNWGGTWPTQDGVYHFKSRWGTQDFPYRYFIKEYKGIGSLRERNRSELLGGYPYFYALPFHALEAAR